MVPLDSFKLTPPGNTSGARTAVINMRDGKSVIIDPNTKKVAKDKQDAMNLFAKSLVYVLTDKVYYTPPDPKKGELRPVPPELTLESLFDAASSFILVPTWGQKQKLNIDQSDYIGGFGEAMDAAIRDILQPKGAKQGDPPPAVPEIMQINAARMLSLAAKSGAPAHYPTILTLLTDPNTDPAILIYAIKAAEGLIGAYNPVWANDVKYATHTIKDAEMVKLVGALDAIVKRTKPYGLPSRAPKPPPPPMPVTPAPSTVDAKNAPPTVGQLQTEMVSKEQQMVVRYYRRAALRAMAQCRYPQFIDAQDGSSVRPLATLAKMAIGDPSITRTPGYDEIAIAVMGLCNLHDYKDVNMDVLFDCVAQGVLNFSGKKTGKPEDHSIPWKVTGSYLITALTDWQKVPNAARYRNKLESLATVLVERVLVPLEKIGTPGFVPNADAVARWREQNPVPELKLFIEAKEPPLKAGFVEPT
ncbi:hypothetical protein [Limnoglobus roseus]|uniref:Uncharacterized protein n=1 Tax=Limnoglobus roseus TaxID=2598579 RepID=A0A5C1ANR0_9BACT|nr:hypothetical protein [Limnoglobus roseus]QEL18498.1 hypothetical protein PX52LOC_05523 [Limnoglobus roseus]